MGSLPTSLQQFLADFIARRRRLAVIKAAALAVAAGLAVALLACLVDRFLQLPASIRGVLLVVDLLAVAAILYRPMTEALASHAKWVEAARQVESLEPAFAQRLITIVSQLESPEPHRGSPGMLAALVDELATFTAGRRAGALLRWRHISRSLTLAGCFVAVTAAAMAIPWLNLPRLMARFTRPWADIAPVTTTLLAVDPGHTRLPQGRPLVVTVQPTRLGTSPLRVHLKEADGWTQHEISPGADGRYAIELPGPAKSTQYFVTGGDARSATFDVQVITVPALADVRARVAFPAYLHWPEKVLTLDAGKLELPTGSEVSLSLVGSEPLADAILQPGGASKPIATSATVDPTVRLAKLPVSKDITLTATLTSQQGVTQAAAMPVTIKAIPDRPPLVRLLVPADELRMYPTDVLTTACQAMDDYGIESMALAIKVNDRAPTYQAVTLTGDRRRIEMTLDCDLAALGVAEGDLLQISLLAKDGAGQQRSSDTLRAIVSPRAFDLNAYLRQNDLKAARAALAEAHKQLVAARDQLNQSADAIGREGNKSLQLLASAAQNAEWAETPLLRAATRSDKRELGDALAAYFDAAEHARAACETLADQRARAVNLDALRGPIDQSAERLRRTVEQLGGIHRGYVAAVYRDDRAAAASVQQRAEKAQPPERERLQAAAKRLLTTSEAAAREAGFDPNVHEGQIALAAQFMAQNPPIDFEPTAREWSAILQRVSPGNALPERANAGVNALVPRLAAAGMIEMVRTDADFVRARDLALASRAARAIESPLLALRPEPADKQAAREYPDALRDLQAVHRLTRQPQGDAGRIETAGRVAREKMLRWAGEVDAQLAIKDSKPLPDDQLAMESAAAVQQKQFEAARKLDEQKAKAARDQQQAKNQLQQLAKQADAAKRLEELRHRQQQLAKQNAQANQQQAMQQMAQAQQALAQDIAKAADELADDAKKSGDAVEAIAKMRQELAELKNEAGRIRAAADEQKRLQQAKQMDPSPIEAANEKLATAVPSAEEARKHIDEKVVAETRAIQQEARAGNAGQVSGRSGKVENEIADAQKKLDAAEEKLAERDALAAAESAAQQAAQQMQQAAQGNKAGQNQAAQQQSAQAAQARTLSALERAAARATMTGGRARIVDIPGVADLFSLLPLLEGGAGSGAIGVAKLDLPAVREWGRLRPREDPNQTAVAPQADPPGYEAALRAYFEALGKEK